MSDQKEPAFKIIPDDKEFVTKIAALIPLEQEDRERLEVLIAGHRQFHAASSPRAELERQLAMEARKSLNLHRLIWSLTTQLGGVSEVKDSAIPFDWNLELEPISDARALRITANRCPSPSAN